MNGFRIRPDCNGLLTMLLLVRNSEIFIMNKRIVYLADDIIVPFFQRFAIYQKNNWNSST